MARFLLGVLWDFLRFAFVVALIGIPSFLIGELLPRSRMRFREFPFKPFRFEDGGKFYEKFRIQAWKDRLPDMSKVMPRAFKKKLTRVALREPRYVKRLIQETCSAEFVHWLLIALSPLVRRLMGEADGALAAFLYCVGNIPFIAIQRYNRPRLVALYEKQLKHYAQPENAVLQYTTTR